ncbi:MAG: FecR domain-containing protein [Saprospiraceae bacterium]|nr:FecR domain-containing protein [Saprospiraceae bacterium]
MNTKRLITLLIKQEKQQLLPKEQEELKQMTKVPTVRKEAEAFRLSKSYQAGFEPKLDQAWSKFKGRIQEEQAQAAPAAKRVSLFPKRIIGIAATIALLIAAFAGYTYLNQPQPTTLASHTELNEQKEILLPDGTRVLINQNSDLQYNDPFIVDGKRQVFLTGEAYFDVQRDEEHPFVIENRHTVVEVLGTAFNLRAYPDEDFTEVEVEEGRVKFSAKDGSMEQVLTVAQKARCFKNDGHINVEDHSSMNAQSWRTGKLLFQNSPIEEIFEDLSRHYRMEIDTDGLAIPTCTFNLLVDTQKRSLSEILTSLQKSLDIDVDKVNNYQIRVSGGKCQVE